MNERIKELVGKAWEQADKEVSEDDWYTWVHDEIFQTKLVELVVRECTKVCNDVGVAIFAEPVQNNFGTAQTCKLAIEKHFGVE
jgi:hypothetical protein